MLYDIAIAANADINLSGTGVTESNMLNALKHFGYKYTESTDHDEDKVWREIDAKRPVCMMGMFESLNTGHAWIATGGTITKSGYIYDVYTFRNRFDFVPMYKYESTGGRFIYYFYMNWGWNGDYNAYYLDIDKDPIHNDDITGRRNIYGIEPNN